MTVFVMLTLLPQEARRFLDHLLPNDTATWRIWKKVILEKLESQEPLSFNESDYEGVAADERSLLATLYGDAEEAYKGFQESRKERYTFMEAGTEVV